MAAKLGILAGAGELPRRVIEACRAAERAYFVLAIAGSCEPATIAAAGAAEWVRLGAGGTGLRRLKAQGCEELVMVGAVRRPSLAQLRPDWRTMRFFAKIGFRALADFGDDALFRAIIAELESEGFRVVGAESVLGGLLAPRGAVGSLVPDDSAKADIAAGLAAALAHGARDRGQAVVVRSGVIAGTEDETGTDALIRRCAGAGGVLVKTAKPNQDRRVDLPAIGPATVAAAAAAGFKGIAVEAGATLVLDRAEVAAAADRAGIFVVGISP